MVKGFFFIIDEPFITKYVFIDENKCKSLDDLVKKISTEFHIEPYQFIVENMPKGDEIKSFPNDYKFKIAIKNCFKDIEFHLPNGKLTKIIDCYKMSFQKVLFNFEQNGFYFSPLCIKNLHILISGKEISTNDHPFLAIPYDSIVEVQLSCKFIVLDYRNKEFIFSENETECEARQLIFDTFKDIEHQIDIIIQNDFTHKKLFYFEKLQSGIKYSVHIPRTFTFQHISNYSCWSFQHMEYYDTVSDAQQRLSMIFCDHGELSPENIIIYNQRKQKVTDKNVFLKDILINKEVYFEIDYETQNKKQKSDQLQKDEIQDSNQTPKTKQPNKKKIKIKPPKKIEIKSPELKISKKSSDSDIENSTDVNHDSKNTELNSIEINFIFDKNNEERFSSFIDSIDINTTIDELEDRIKLKCKISNSIKLSYIEQENKITIDKEMTIKDILNEIKEKDESGKFKNVLYINIIEFNKTDEDHKANKLLTKPEPSSENSYQKFKQEKQTDVIKESKQFQYEMIIKPSSSSSDDDNHNDNVRKKSKKKKKDIRKFMPTKIQINNSPSASSVKNKQETIKERYKFEYNNREKILRLDTNSRLKDNEQIIKNKFGISKAQKLDFFIIKNDQDDPEETMINNKKRKMETLKNYTIKIYQQDESDEHLHDDDQEYQEHQETHEIKQINGCNNNDNDNSNVNDDIIEGEVAKDKIENEQEEEKEIKNSKCKYYYQTNRKDEIEEIEFDAGTSVKEMKQIIAENNGVDSLSNIKVIFAGKDLLNELILDDLEIGDIPLYVYIRSIEDILLMTAKALVVKKEDLDAFEEEEEEEEAE